MAEGAFTRRTVSLSGAAVFGALAAVVTVIIPASIEPSFPILPFLKFDPAELFSVLAFLVFGPVAAFVTAIVHWIFLTASGSTPLGPTVKFSAVLATLLGLWAGSKIYARFWPEGHRLYLLVALMLSFASLFRVSMLLVINYFVFTYIGPVIFGIDYLGFSQHVLEVTLGLSFAGPSQVLRAMLVYTSVFNVLHAVFSVVLPYALFTPISMNVPEIASANPWISRFTARN